MTRDPVQEPEPQREGGGGEAVGVEAPGAEARHAEAGGAEVESLAGSDSARLRFLAVACLGGQETEEAITGLKSLAADKDPIVRLQAALRLARLGRKEAVPVLLKLRRLNARSISAPLPGLSVPLAADGACPLRFTLGASPLLSSGSSSCLDFWTMATSRLPVVEPFSSFGPSAPSLDVTYYGLG